MEATARLLAGRAAVNQTTSAFAEVSVGLSQLLMMNWQADMGIAPGRERDSPEDEQQRSSVK
eukprot:552867-Amphidinium_carterae.1